MRATPYHSAPPPATNNPKSKPHTIYVVYTYSSADIALIALALSYKVVIYILE